MGNITEFPGKKKRAKKNKISDEDKKFLIEQFASMIENSEVEGDDLLDIAVSADLFQLYLQQFPCFAGYGDKIEFNAIMRAYDEGELTEEQDLAVECVLDLLSDQYFDFSLKDAFQLWGQGDLAAFIKILGFHSISVEIENKMDGDE